MRACKISEVLCLFLFVGVVSSFAVAQTTENEQAFATSGKESKSGIVSKGGELKTSSSPDSDASMNIRVQEKDTFYKLYEDVKAKLLSDVKWLLLLLSSAIVVATIGGFYTLKDVINSKVDQHIREREQRFQKLESDTVAQINQTRVNIGILEKELQNLTNDTQIRFSDKISELDKQLEEVKSKVLEAMSITRAYQLVSQNEERTKELSNEDKLFLKMMKRLLELGVNDPDVPLFIGVIENNLELVKDSMELGGNPHLPRGDLMNRYRALLHQEFPGVI
jgi:hypothetical protein